MRPDAQNRQRSSNTGASSTPKPQRFDILLSLCVSFVVLHVLCYSLYVGVSCWNNNRRRITGRVLVRTQSFKVHHTHAQHQTSACPARTRSWQARERARAARWVAGRQVIQEQIAERQLHRMEEEEARVQEGEAIKKVTS